MKKKLTAILAIAMIGLTACTNEGTSVETTTTTEATTTTAEATTTTVEVTTTIEETTTVEETAEPIDYSNFSVADYCGELDNVKPVAYTAETVEYTVGAYTNEQNQVAIEAIKATDVYAEVISCAKEMFTYDNGTFSANEGYSEHFMVPDYLKCLAYENDDFVINPILTQTFAYKFDGVNEETVLVYEIPLVESRLMSSSTATYCVPVYINANNEAFVLDEASSQCSSMSMLYNYADGTTHLMFETGVSQGSQQNYIYSFNNGAPKYEYAASYIDPNADGTAFVCNYNTAMFFRDEVSNSYCNVAVEEASEELAEIIINAEAVNKAFPDIKEYYAENGMKVFGGKYIQACNTAFTFENGEVVEYGDYCWVSSSEEDTNYNVMF